MFFFNHHVNKSGCRLIHGEKSPGKEINSETSGALIQLRRNQSPEVSMHPEVGGGGVVGGGRVIVWGEGVQMLLKSSGVRWVGGGLIRERVC